MFLLKFFLFLTPLYARECPDLFHKSNVVRLRTSYSSEQQTLNVLNNLIRNYDFSIVGFNGKGVYKYKLEISGGKEIRMKIIDTSKANDHPDYLIWETLISAGLYRPFDFDFDRNDISIKYTRRFHRIFSEEQLLIGDVPNSDMKKMTVISTLLNYGQDSFNLLLTKKRPRDRLPDENKILSADEVWTTLQLPPSTD